MSGAILRFVLAAMGLALVAAATAETVACSSADTQCDCADPALRVHVPSESAVAVSEVRVSGTACEGATVSCIQPGTEGGCASYQFAAKAAGTCHVEVLFATGGSVARDVSITEATGCCAGFFAQPATEGDIAVTPPPSGTAPADAGDEG
jgi:hypothetical protein